MTDDNSLFLRWASVVSLGAVGGWLIINLWSPYDEYVYLSVPSVVAGLGFLLCGFMIAIVLREAHRIAVGVGVFGVTAFLAPIGATVSTAFLLGRVGVLDVMLYQAVLRILLVFVPVFLLVAGGATSAFLLLRN